MEAFASLSRKAAGSQGRALRRGSQAAESLFETRCPTRVSMKTNKKGKTVPSDGLSRELRVCGRAFLFFFSLIFAKAKIKRGVSPVAASDQVPPGRASLRGWTAPGRRPGPILGVRPLFLVKLCSARRAHIRHMERLGLQCSPAMRAMQPLALHNHRHHDRCQHRKRQRSAQRCAENVHAGKTDIQPAG